MLPGGLVHLKGSAEKILKEGASEMQEYFTAMPKISENMKVFFSEGISTKRGMLTDKNENKKSKMVQNPFIFGIPFRFMGA